MYYIKLLLLMGAMLAASSAAKLGERVTVHKSDSTDENSNVKVKKVTPWRYFVDFVKCRT